MARVNWWSRRDAIVAAPSNEQTCLLPPHLRTWVNFRRYFYDHNLVKPPKPWFCDERVREPSTTTTTAGGITTVQPEYGWKPVRWWDGDGDGNSGFGVWGLVFSHFRLLLPLCSRIVKLWRWTLEWIKLTLSCFHRRRNRRLIWQPIFGDDEPDDFSIW